MFSIDRYIVVFYPYIIYKVNGCLRILLRGPKRKHVPQYFVFLLGKTLGSEQNFPNECFSAEHAAMPASLLWIQKWERRDFQDCVIRVWSVSRFSLQAHIFLYNWSLSQVKVKRDWRGALLKYFLVRTVLPIIILSFSNIRLLMLVKRESEWPDHHYKVYALLAVVFFFILFNFPSLVIILWDIIDFRRVNACKQFDRYIGYSTYNIIYTDVGNVWGWEF